MTIIEHWQIDGGYYRLSEKLLHYEEFEGYANTATKITYKSDEVILEFERYSPKVKNIKIDKVINDLIHLYLCGSIFNKVVENYYEKEIPTKSVFVVDNYKVSILDSFNRYLDKNNLYVFYQDGYVFISKKDSSLQEDISEIGDYFSKNTLKIALGLDFIEIQEYDK